MRVLVLSKRQYTGKDLLDDRYGRLYELPLGLAGLGHEVRAMVLSYRSREQVRRSEAGVSWQSVNLFPTPFRYWRGVTKAVEEFQPEVIWASSDAVHAVIGARLRSRFGVPLVVDLYDDYEAFALNRLPGLQSLYRAACRRADGLSVVSRTLAEILRLRNSVTGVLEVIENGVKAGFGRGLVRMESRKALGLPLGLKLVGTAGALDESRGIEDLFQAFKLLQSENSDIRLVVAGPRNGLTENLSAEKVIDLGIVPHSEIPTLFSALDVGIVCNRDSAFGRACHPQKLVEMIACGLPVVAASVGEAALMLASQPSSLYAPGNHVELARCIDAQLQTPMRSSLSVIADWDSLAQRLEGLLLDASLRAKMSGG